MKYRMANPTEELAAAHGGANRGIVLSSAVLEAGGEEHELKELRQRGVLISLGRGVDRLRDHPFDFFAQCAAALALAGRGAVLGLRTAARLLGFYAYRGSTVVEVIVLRGRDQRTTVGRVVQTRWLPDQHVMSVDGLPVTTVGRTFFDLCGDPDVGLRRRGGHPVHERTMERVYNDCLGRRGLTFTQEAAVLLVMAKQGRRGTSLVRNLLLKHGPKYVPTGSDTESLFMELVVAYGLPDPERQVPISGPDGFIGTVDFLWRRAEHVVEVDSTWHDGPLDEEDDVLRDKRLEAAGYTVKRYRYGQLIAGASAVARELGVATST